MDRRVDRFYEFGPFKLDTAESCLVRGEEILPLTPKLFSLLMRFIESGGRTLSKGDLVEALWSDVAVSDAALAKNVSRLKKILRDGQDGQRYIETLSGRGYRFVVEARPIHDTAEALADFPKPQQGAHRDEAFKRLTSLLGTHARHVIGASVLYASLYAAALLVEVAYDWDRYAGRALIVAAGVFCGMLLASASALVADWKLTFKRGALGLAVSALIFGVASALLFVAVRQFLPAHPITQASFQTYTAQAAYLKEIVYFLVLAAFFVIGPFHFILSMERDVLYGRHGQVLEGLTSSRVTIAPKGKLYLGLLAVLIAVFIIRSSFDHAHLLDNLSPAPYKNLFIQLIYLRLALAFALVVECLIWFYRSLNNLKLQCVTRAESAR